MAAFRLIRYLAPWRSGRARREEQLLSLRQRDGDNCARCRRPIRFDRAAGHDLAARIEPIDSAAASAELANLCLTHGRCNAQGFDHTDEVMERLRPSREADLFRKAREQRAA